MVSPQQSLFCWSEEMEKLSFATNVSEKSWKHSLFGRRRSVPQMRLSFFSKKGSQSSVGEEDTLCSEHTLSDPGEFAMEGEEYDLCSSFGVINQVADAPFGQDQLVASIQAKQPFIDTQLHRPKNAQHVVSLLQQGYDPNMCDRTPDSLCPIHAIVRSRKPNRADCLEALLTHSNVDVNASDAHMMSALHFAAMNGDMRCVKLLLAFSADINMISEFDQTPMNIAVAHDQENVIKLLEALKGITASFVEPKTYRPLPVMFRPSHYKQYFPLSPASSDGELEVVTQISSDRFSMFGGAASMDSMNLLDTENLSQAHLHNLFTFNEDDLVSMVTHGRAFFHDHMQHLMHTLTFKLHNGHKILCLDGGWMRTLIQIDILEQLESFTGQKITDIFDMLIGCSSGALVVLGLVYGECSLGMLRQLLFKMKNELFSNPSNDPSYNTALLKEFVRAVTGRDLKMSDIKSPSVMIPAVYREQANELQLKFFTNFANDIYSQESVFGAAISATATPAWFSSNGQFVDGSVLANNPIDYALSYLQYHNYLIRQCYPISMIVSLGAGVYSADKLRGLQPPSPKHKDGFQRVQNLTQIMKQSILQSDQIASCCANRCQQLGIKFFRFNPHLKETVSVSETETRKLINMILRARIEMNNDNTGIETLKQYFVKLTESYTANGSGLGPYSSGAVSPDCGLVIRTSSDTSGDEGKVKTKRTL